MILVLRALGVGDLATGVPALRGLRRAYPDDELVLATPQWLRPLVDLVGGIDRLLPTGDPLPERLPVRPRLAVNLHGRGPGSHRLLRSTRPTRLYAFASPAAGHLTGPHWTAAEHEVDRWCRLLAWYGVPCAPDDLALPVPPARDLPVATAVVHPGAKSAARRWPPDRFAAVARALAERGHRVVVTGSPAEEALARRVAAQAGLAPTAALAGGTDLGDLAWLVANARLVASGDTGVAHLATAFGTPSVTLFGPVPPRRWGPPPGRPRHQAIWPGPAEPDPSGGPHPALLRIRPAEVLRRADQALAAEGLAAPTVG